MRRLGLWMAILGVAGCATAGPAPPAVDVNGRWTGTWLGYGVELIPREDRAWAELEQNGATGAGRLQLENTGAAESVPLVVRAAGTTGIRVLLQVSGTSITMRHDLSSELFVADFTVNGDRMVGTVRGADPPVGIVLTRAKPPAPAEAPVAVAPPPPPSPPAPPAPPPAPVKPPEVAAAAPPPAAPPRPAPAEFERREALRSVYFDFDRADIRPDDVAVLDANARWLKERPEALVLIEGHADERGTNEYNLALGERRAQAARDYLVSRGVAAERLATVSYGEERPVCIERTEACWRRNRRADFLTRLR